MSFRLKTILGIALIESILLILLIFSGMHFFNNSNESNLKQRAESTSIIFSKAIKDPLLSLDLATLESFTQDILTIPDIIYVRISNNDFILTEAGAPQFLHRPHIADVSLADVSDGTFDIIIDVVEGNVFHGKIEMGFSISSIEKATSKAQHWAAAIAIIEVCLVAIFSYILGTFLTRQLQQLKKASEKIAVSGPGHQIIVSGKDEIADVAKAFNTMSSTLLENYTKLSQSIDKEIKSSNTAKLNQAQNTAILSVSLDAIIIIDQTGQVVDYNPVAEDIFGWTYEEIFSKNLADYIIPKHKRSAHKAGMKAFLLSRESPVINQRLELTALHKQGHTFPIEINIAPVENEEDIFFIAFIRDISSRLEAETELRLAAQTFESSEAMFISNAQGHIIRINQAFTGITGYNEQDALGQNPSLLSSGKHAPEYYQEMWSTLTSEGKWSGEIYNKRKNGEIYPEYLSISSVKNNQNIITHYIAHFIDITDQKNIEANLQLARREADASNESKSRFLASMSHEIRTPMNAVLGILDLLTDTDLTAKQLNLISTARNSGELLMTIINDILDFTKMDVDAQVLQYSEFDLHHLLTDCIKLLQNLADKKALKLSIVQSADLPQFVKGDPERIKQILINLINNAIKFTEQGVIKVIVNLDSQLADKLFLRIQVSDTGIGIHPENQAQLFNEFTMVDQTHTRKYEGTGLGLAICKRLVTLMNGSITVHSEFGKGSIFEFTIELQVADKNNIQHALFQEQTLPPAINTRILLAEDNTANQMVIRSILEHAKMLVDVVSNGIEAVDAVQKNRYDIVLMDISMPEMDGMTATKAIRSLASSDCHIPIIALTAHTLSGDKERFLDAGMNDYLSKPLNRKTALNCIATWTRGQQATEEQAREHTPEPCDEYPYVDEKVLLQLVMDTDAEIVPTLITMYIEDTKQRIQIMCDATTNKDIKTLEFEAHTVGSSAVAHGNAKLHRVSRKIEFLCQENENQKALKEALQIADIAEQSFHLLALRANKGF